MKIKALISMITIFFAMAVTSCGGSESSTDDGRSDYESPETSLSGISGKWIESHQEPVTGCLIISVLTIKYDGSGHFIQSATCGIAREEILADEPVRIEREGEKLYVYFGRARDTFFVRHGVVCNPNGKEMTRSR